MRLAESAADAYIQALLRTARGSVRDGSVRGAFSLVETLQALAAGTTRFAEYTTPAALVGIALCATPLAGPVFRAGRRVLGWLGRKPVLAALVIAGVALASSFGLSLARGIPAPIVHDEFAYLLTADTLAHGRLTNPTHPMWVFFESMHIFHVPTYQAKYPPGQGAVLALGQVVFARYIAGVWLVQAMAAVAFLYALRPIVGARWAVLGALLCALHPQVMTWSQRYWGGSLAMLGGALLLGGFARIWVRYGDGTWKPAPGRTPGLHAASMAVGMAILAISRPFEGFCLSAILCLLLGVRLLRRCESPALVSRILGPIILVLLPVAAFLGYYNYRVTGHPLRLPYQLHHATYDVSPLFVFEKPATAPHYNHREMERFHTVRQMHWYHLRDRTGRALEEVWINLADRLFHSAVGEAGDLPNPLWVGFPLKDATFAGWAENEHRDQRQLKSLSEGAKRGELTAKQRQHLERLEWRQWVPREIPFTAVALALVLPAALRRGRWVRLGIGVLAPFTALLMLETYMQPHYGAPAAALVAAVLLLLLRRLNTWRWRGIDIGRFLARAVLVLFAINSIQRAAALGLTAQEPWAVHRQQIERRLEAAGGRHLVIVRYDARHPDIDEWVYNRADIDAAPVVWAREMAPEQTRKLLDYFRDRKVWLLRADARDPQIEAYVLPTTLPAEPDDGEELEE